MIALLAGLVLGAACAFLWARLVRRALLPALVALTVAGCASPRPWEYAQVNCLQHANRAAIVAIEHGYQAGVVHNFRNGQAHAVTWIDIDGERVYWDAAFREYLTAARVGEVLLVVDGPSRGAMERLYQLRDRYGAQP